MGAAYNEVVRPHLNTVFQVQTPNANGWDRYAEAGGKYLTQMFILAGLRRHNLFVDLGSGTGHVVIQAAMEFGCKAIGIENRRDRKQLGLRLRGAVAKRCPTKPQKELKWKRRLAVSGSHGKYSKKRVRFIEDDFVNGNEAANIISKADVVFCNNRRFRASLATTTLQDLLTVAHRMKRGARLVVVNDIVNGHYAGTPFDPQGTMSHASRRGDIVSEAPSFTWWSYRRL